jgi:hypothetical protein
MMDKALRTQCEAQKTAHTFILGSISGVLPMVKLVALLTTFSAGIFLTHATEAYLTADKAYCISEQAPPPAGVDQVPPNPSDLTFGPH